jgi:serine phosphatase RsbU (regulator of sigma subunit)
MMNFSLDEHAEQILVVSSDGISAERISEVLGTRGFRSQWAPTLAAAARIAEQDLFDLLIIDHPAAAPLPADILTEVETDSQLRRFPLILCHPAADTLPQQRLDSAPFRVHMLPCPWDPILFLVRVSAELRLRKIRNEESRFLSAVAGQNFELRDLTNRFLRELREAQAIQAALMPTALPSAPQTRFAAAYVPLDAVGGDLYDIWHIEKSRYGLFIGDVTGHGLSAALIGAMTKMALSHAGKTAPHTMLTEMNRALAPLMPEGRFVTAEAAFYCAETGALSLVRAGHPPAFLWRAATRRVEQIGPRGLALGMVEETAYDLYSDCLGAGDKLLMVTDGLTETGNMQAELLGVDGVARMFAEVAEALPIHSCIEELLSRREKFSGGRIVKDDIALIGLERVAAE